MKIKYNTNDLMVNWKPTFFILVYHKMVWHQTVIAEVAACIC